MSPDDIDKLARASYEYKVNKDGEFGLAFVAIYCASWAICWAVDYWNRKQ